MTWPGSMGPAQVRVPLTTPSPPTEHILELVLGNNTSVGLPLGHCLLRMGCARGHTVLKTNTTQCSVAWTLPYPLESPESSSYPGRDHTAAALASGRADGLGASPSSASGAEDPPRRPPLSMQVRIGQEGFQGGRAFSRHQTLGRSCPDLREKWMWAWGYLLSRQKGSPGCLAQEDRLL